MHVGIYETRQDKATPGINFGDVGIGQSNGIKRTNRTDAVVLDQHASIGQRLAAVAINQSAVANK